VAEARNDYGRAYSIDAEALGKPGERRFRLVVISGGQNACVWMEKQQLGSIGEWLKEMCDRLDEENPKDVPDVEPAPVPLNFELDIRARQLALGYQEEDDLFVIQAFDLEHDESADPRPTFRCELIRGQARVLSRKIESVVSAGRPICPLCESPMDPGGHVCPRSNGHYAGVGV
jgi:uncharacterized repeat protein (TIGR03847 family)